MKKKLIRKLFTMSRNNDRAIGNLLNFPYFKQKSGRFISVHLNQPIKLRDPQQINFTGKLKGQNHSATIFFVIE